MGIGKSLVFTSYIISAATCFLIYGALSQNKSSLKCPTFFKYGRDVMRKKGITGADILTIVLSLPKDHPKRNSLINFMNTAFIKSGTLPQSKEDKFMDIVKDLKKEGLL